MSRAPDSVLDYFGKVSGFSPEASRLTRGSQNPSGTFVGYLAELMLDPSKLIFTDSLRGQDNPIVSIDQLNSAIDLAPNRISGNEILQISKSTVLKVGWRVKMGEAEALIFLATKTNIPVPTVSSAYTIGDIGFILMSKIEGEMLSSRWENISHGERQSVIRQLESYILEWRKLGSSFIG